MANVTSCTTMPVTSNGIFQHDNPVKFELPLLILQICIVLVVTRTLAVLLKPLRQPRVIAEIIGGILLGPSALGKIHAFKNTMFPKQSLTVLETIADLGLIFFLFLVGLELDLKTIKRTGRHAMSIAAAGITVPFVAGVGVSVVLHNTIVKGSNFAPFLVFMGVAMSITAFPVLARILAERRLLTTDVGQMAMSAAAVNDVVAWVLLALAVALSGSNTSPLVAIWVMICGVAFVGLMFVVVKPMMTMIAHQAIENEPISEIYVTITLAGVLAAGFITDLIGIHSIFGAFIFGLVIPKEGPFAGCLIEKIEDLVTILMLPLYFVLSGLKTNIGSIHGAQSGGLLVLVIATACFGKIIGTFVVASLHRMDFRKSLTLGFLMNTKGLVELIVLNIGKDRKVLNDETFAIMVLMALFTTFITTPVVMALYKPARDPVPYKRRTLYSSDPKLDQDTEFRILACVHGMPNVHAIINLTEALRGTARCKPLDMYILHLLEYSERPSSIMKLQKVRRNGLPFWEEEVQEGQENQDVDNTVVAFGVYGQLSKVNVRPMTAISRFDDMHEDVCVTAADKRAAVIILPFHKYARPDYIAGSGGWEGHTPGLRHVTQKVLTHAPCSVGILVDRGIGITSLSSSYVDHNLAVFFFGGPDDREALAFGYRMAEHPGINLTVYRFVLRNEQQPQQQEDGAQEPDTTLHTQSFSINSRFSSSHDYMVSDMDWAKETKLDEECLTMAKKQKHKQVGAPGEPNIIRYEEKPVVDPIDGALSIARVEVERLTLVVLGRGRRPSPLIAPLSGKQAEYPELGPVGEALTTATDVRCSVLVLQQHDPALVHEAPPSTKIIDVSTPKPSGLISLSPSMVVATCPASPSNYSNGEINRAYLTPSQTPPPPV